MNIQIVILPYNGILFSEKKKKEWTSDRHHTRDKSHKNYIE